ncbi:MAG: hypothetical protein JST00_27510 [Deltaproteobacteria bacterium]|nr:hypothetical protein [Deltaproteobacteria bacterium]
MIRSRFLVALVALVALLGASLRAPALEVVRRAAGSLEAVATTRREAQVALDERTSDHARARVARSGDGSRDASLLALASSWCDLRLGARPVARPRAPRGATWSAPPPTHAELMVFLN